MVLRRLISTTKEMYSTWIIQVFLFVISLYFVHSAPYQNITDGRTFREKGCYYLSEHYQNGERIDTYEPCLNCTCLNSVLMCYLRICPFVKPVGEECIVERDEGDCCPKIWCPEVINENSEQVRQEPGCYLEGKYYPDGAQLPHDPKHPCEVCYCIRNSTACVVQECELKVEGCSPIYKEGQCCPGRYNCTYEEATPTPPGVTVSELAEGCYLDDGTFVADGEAVNTTNPCEHCYCMRNEVVCAIQECQAPSNNCKPVPPKPDQCCPDRYECVISSESSDGMGASEGLKFTTVFTKDFTVSHIPSYLENHNTGIKGVPKKEIDEELTPIHQGFPKYPSTVPSVEDYETTSFSEAHSSLKPSINPETESESNNYSAETSPPSKALEVKRIVSTPLSSTEAPSLNTESEDFETTEHESQPQEISTKASRPSTEESSPNPETLKSVGVKDASKTQPSESTNFPSEENDEIPAAVSGEELNKQPPSVSSDQQFSAPSTSESNEKRIGIQELKGIKGRRPSPSISDLGERPLKRPLGNAFKQEGIKQSGIRDPQRTSPHNIKGKRPVSQGKPILPVGVIPGEKRDPVQTTRQPVVVQPIPGEGICRIGDSIYRHGEEIPPMNTCKKNCRCINSKVYCEEITCYTTDHPGCRKIQIEDECCPRYECGTEETSSVESVSTTEVSYEDYLFVTSGVTDLKEHITKDTETIIVNEGDIDLENTKDSSSTPSTTHGASIEDSSSTSYVENGDTSTEIYESTHATQLSSKVSITPSTETIDTTTTDTKTNSEETFPTTTGISTIKTTVSDAGITEAPSVSTTFTSESITEMISTQKTVEFSSIKDNNIIFETSSTEGIISEVTTNGPSKTTVSGEITSESEEINLETITKRVTESTVSEDPHELTTTAIYSEDAVKSTVKPNAEDMDLSSSQKPFEEVTDDIQTKVGSESAEHSTETYLSSESTSEHQNPFIKSTTHSEEVETTVKPNLDETNLLSSQKPLDEMTEDYQIKGVSDYKDSSDISTKTQILKESTTEFIHEKTEKITTKFDVSSENLTDSFIISTKDSPDVFHVTETETSKNPTVFTSTTEKAEDVVTTKIPHTTENESIFAKITAFFSSTPTIPTTESTEVPKLSDTSDSSTYSEEFTTQHKDTEMTTTPSHFSEKLEDSSVLNVGTDAPSNFFEKSQTSHLFSTDAPHSTSISTELVDTKNEIPSASISDSNEQGSGLGISAEETSSEIPHLKETTEIPNEDVHSTEYLVTEKYSELNTKKSFESTIPDISTEHPIKALHTTTYETVVEVTSEPDNQEPTLKEIQSTTSQESTSKVTLEVPSKSEPEEQYRRPASAITNDETTVGVDTKDHTGTNHLSFQTDDSLTTFSSLSGSTSAGGDQDSTTKYSTNDITTDFKLTYDESTTSKGSFEPENLLFSTLPPDPSGLIKKTLPSSVNDEDSVETTIQDVLEPQNSSIESDISGLVKKTATTAEDFEESTKETTTVAETSISPDTILQSGASHLETKDTTLINVHESSYTERISSTTQDSYSQHFEITTIASDSSAEPDSSSESEEGSTNTKESSAAAHDGFSPENLSITTFQPVAPDSERKTVNPLAEDIFPITQDTEALSSSTPKATTYIETSTTYAESTPKEKTSHFEEETFAQEVTTAKEIVVSTEHPDIYDKTIEPDSFTDAPEENRPTEFEFGGLESDKDKHSVNEEEWKDHLGIILDPVETHAPISDQHVFGTASEESESISTTVAPIITKTTQENLVTEQSDDHLTSTSHPHVEYGTTYSTQVPHGITDSHLDSQTVKDETSDSENLNDYISESTSKDDLSIVESMQDSPKTDAPSDSDHFTKESFEIPFKDSNNSEFVEKLTTEEIEVTLEHIDESNSKSSYGISSQHSGETSSVTYAQYTTEQVEALDQTQFSKEKNSAENIETTINPIYSSTQKTWEKVETTASSVRYSTEYPTEEHAEISDSTVSTKLPSTIYAKTTENPSYFSTKNEEYSETIASQENTATEQPATEESDTVTRVHHSTEHSEKTDDDLLTSKDKPFTEVGEATGSTDLISKERPSSEYGDTSFDHSTEHSEKTDDDLLTSKDKPFTEVGEATGSTDFISKERPSSEYGDTSFDLVQTSTNQPANEYTETISTKPPTDAHTIISTKQPVPDKLETDHPTYSSTKEPYAEHVDTTFVPSHYPTEKHEEITYTTESSSKHQPLTEDEKITYSDDYSSTKQPVEVHEETTRKGHYPSEQNDELSETTSSLHFTKQHEEETIKTEHYSSEQPTKEHSDTTHSSFHFSTKRPVTEYEETTASPTSISSEKAETSITTSNQAKTTLSSSYVFSEKHVVEHTETTSNPSHFSTEQTGLPVTLSHIPSDDLTQDNLETTDSSVYFSTEKPIDIHSEKTPFNSEGTEEKIHSEYYPTDHQTEHPVTTFSSSEYITEFQQASEDQKSSTEDDDFTQYKDTTLGHFHVSELSEPTTQKYSEEHSTFKVSSQVPVIEEKVTQHTQTHAEIATDNSSENIKSSVETESSSYSQDYPSTFDQYITLHDSEPYDKKSTPEEDSNKFTTVKFIQSDDALEKNYNLSSFSDELVSEHTETINATPTEKTVSEEEYYDSQTTLESHSSRRTTVMPDASITNDGFDPDDKGGKHEENIEKLNEIPIVTEIPHQSSKEVTTAEVTEKEGFTTPERFPEDKTGLTTLTSNITDIVEESPSGNEIEESESIGNAVTSDDITTKSFHPKLSVVTFIIRGTTSTPSVDVSKVGNVTVTNEIEKISTTPAVVTSTKDESLEKVTTSPTVETDFFTNTSEKDKTTVFLENKLSTTSAPSTSVTPESKDTTSDEKESTTSVYVDFTTYFNLDDFDIKEGNQYTTTKFSQDDRLSTSSDTVHETEEKNTYHSFNVEDNEKNSSTEGIQNFDISNKSTQPSSEHDVTDNEIIKSTNTSYNIDVEQDLINDSQKMTEKVKTTTEKILDTDLLTLSIANDHKTDQIEESYTTEKQNEDNYVFEKVTDTTLKVTKHHLDEADETRVKEPTESTTVEIHQEEEKGDGDFGSEGPVSFEQSITQIAGFADTEKPSGFHETLSSHVGLKATDKPEKINVSTTLDTTQSSANSDEDVSTIENKVQSFDETTMFVQQSEETEEPFTTHVFSDEHKVSIHPIDTTDTNEFGFERNTKLGTDNSFSTAIPNDPSTFASEKYTQKDEDSHITHPHKFEESSTTSTINLEHLDLDERKRITTSDSFTSTTDYETTEKSSSLGEELHISSLLTTFETGEDSKDASSLSKDTSQTAPTTTSNAFLPSSTTKYFDNEDVFQTSTTDSIFPTTGTEQALEFETEKAQEFTVSSQPQDLIGNETGSDYPLVEEILISAHVPHPVKEHSSSPSLISLSTDGSVTTPSPKEAFSTKGDKSTSSYPTTESFTEDTSLTQDYGFHKETYSPYIHNISTNDVESTKSSADSLDSHPSKSTESYISYTETKEATSERNRTPSMEAEDQEKYQTDSYYTESNIGETKPLLIPGNLIFLPEKPLDENNETYPDSTHLKLDGIFAKKPFGTEKAQTEAVTEVPFTLKPLTETEKISTSLVDNAFDQDFGFLSETQNPPKQMDVENKDILKSTTMLLAAIETSNNSTAEPSTEHTNPLFSTKTPEEILYLTNRPELVTESAIFTFPAEAVVFDSHVNKDNFNVILTNEPSEDTDVTSEEATTLTSETEYPKADYGSITNVPGASKYPETEHTEVILHSTSTADSFDLDTETTSESSFVSTFTSKIHEETKTPVTTDFPDKIKTVFKEPTESDNLSTLILETTEENKIHSVHDKSEDITTKKPVDETTVTYPDSITSTKLSSSTIVPTLLTEKIETTNKDNTESEKYPGSIEDIAFELTTITSDHISSHATVKSIETSSSKDVSDFETTKHESPYDYITTSKIDVESFVTSSTTDTNGKPITSTGDYENSSVEVDTPKPSTPPSTTNILSGTSTIEESETIIPSNTTMQRSTQKTEFFSDENDSITTPAIYPDESGSLTDHETASIPFISDSSKLKHASSVLPIYKPTIEDIVFKPITSTELPITSTANASEASWLAKATQVPQQKVPVSTLSSTTQEFLKATIFPHSIPPSALFESQGHSSTLPPLHPHQAGTDSQHEDSPHSSQEDGYCLYESEIYRSAEQIPRKDPCEFCFCFRGDIICLQQSCPPPIRGCYATPIPGFCCPRFHCPVKEMHFNLTRTTTTTTADPRIGKILVPAAIETTGCAIEGKVYRAHQVVRPASGPCMLCRCETGGIMKCDPRDCQPQAPLLLRLNRDFFKKR